MGLILGNLISKRRNTKKKKKSKKKNTKKKNPKYSLKNSKKRIVSKKKKNKSKHKSIKCKQQKGGLIENNEHYIEQRKINGATARLFFSKITNSDEFRVLPIELIDMIGSHIKYEIDMVDSKLSYHEQFKFLLSRLRTMEDFIFFNNYINQLFREFSKSKKITEPLFSQIKLFSIYPDLDIFKKKGGPNYNRFLNIGESMGEEDGVKWITISLNKLNKQIIKNKLIKLWPSDKENLSLTDIYELLKEYCIYDYDEDTKKTYRPFANIQGLTLSGKKKDVNEPNYQISDVSENKSLLDYLLKYDTRWVGYHVIEASLNDYFV